MAYSDDHPTIAAVRARAPMPPPPTVDQLRRIALDAGADDVGFVSIDHPDVADQKADILAAFPYARTLIAIVNRMHRDNIRSMARSAANLEFHRCGDETDAIAHRIAQALDSFGLRAAYPAMGFPMEVGRWPGKMWTISHKPVAVAAGLGRMGLHRNVIHPKFGNFILLNTVVTSLELDQYSRPIDYNPCLDCKLCVAVCPTGAISSDGAFNFGSCFTHNYREFMGGFIDWVDTIADARDHRAYRSKVSDAETVSVWQSLSFGPNYKAAYCLAVCPAGEDVIGPYLADRKGFLDDMVSPFRDLEETIYAIPGSDAEAYVQKRFPHKRLKRVGHGVRVTSVAGFLQGMFVAFQPGQSKGLNAVFHFRSTGRETRHATITIRNQTLDVQDGIHGRADLQLTVDAVSWVNFVRKEASLPWAILRGKIRVRGNPKLLLAFGKCFP